VISALVVGLGNIGLKFDLDCDGDTAMTHTGACLAHPSVELLGGVDPDSKARALFEESSSRQAFVELEEVSKRNLEPALFIISTPTETHLEVVKEALDLKPKAILLEKPLANSTEDGRTIVQLCKSAGVLLAVNYFRRFDKRIVEIGEQIQSGDFGRPCFVSCVYSGGLLNNGSHYLDMLMAWFGKPRAVNRLSVPTDAGAGPITSAFILDYLDFHVSFEAVEPNYGLGEFDLFFERGRVRFENYCEDVIVMGSEIDPIFPRYKRLRTIDRAAGGLDAKKYQFWVLDGMVGAMSRGAKIPSTGDTALGVLEICMDVLNAEPRC